MIPWTLACQSSPSFTVSQNLLKFMSFESSMSMSHPTISSSVTSFFFCPHSFPASGYFPVKKTFQIFVLGSQIIGGSASAWVLPINIQGWFPLELTGLISLQFKGLSRVCSSTTIQKHQFFDSQPFLWSNCTSIHDYWKNYNFDYTDLCRQSDASAF